MTDFTIRKNLLGDSIWPEPALSAAGMASPEGYIRLFVEDQEVRTLYRHNPHIRLVDEPGGMVLDCSKAWHHAIDNNEYFSTGFWPQVGVERKPDARIHFKLHGSLIYPDETILLCPFSASCSSQQGEPPNKTMPPIWWEELAEKIQDRDTMDRVATLGGKDEPKINGTFNWRGKPLRTAAELILSCRVLVAVETWGAVIAGGKRIGKTILLNSATPISLHADPGMIERGVKVIRAKFPWEWPMDEIIEEVMRGLE